MTPEFSTTACFLASIGMLLVLLADVSSLDPHKGDPNVQR